MAVPDLASPSRNTEARPAPAEPTMMNLAYFQDNQIEAAFATAFQLQSQRATLIPVALFDSLGYTIAFCQLVTFARAAGDDIPKRLRIRCILAAALHLGVLVCLMNLLHSVYKHASSNRQVCTERAKALYRIVEGGGMLAMLLLMSSEGSGGDAEGMGLAYPERFVRSTASAFIMNNTFSAFDMVRVESYAWVLLLRLQCFLMAELGGAPSVLLRSSYGLPGVVVMYLVLGCVAPMAISFCLEGLMRRSFAARHNIPFSQLGLLWHPFGPQHCISSLLSRWRCGASSSPSLPHPSSQGVAANAPSTARSRGGLQEHQHLHEE